MDRMPGRHAEGLKIIHQAREQQESLYHVILKVKYLLTPSQVLLAHRYFENSYIELRLMIIHESLQSPNYFAVFS